MGFVFQSFALFLHMDVANNIAFGLRMRKVPEGEVKEKVESALEIVHITGLGNRRINELSGGQQQRVALARALVLHPSLLLMDEPLSNLDAKLRASVRVEIAQIKKVLGITTILVTHDQVEAMTMGDRIALMQDGIIQQISKPIVIYEFPANMFVAGFVGSPSINFFRIRIDETYSLISEFGAAVPVHSFCECLKCDFKVIDVPEGEYILGVCPEDILIHNQIMNDHSIAKKVANTEIVSGLPRVVTDMKSNDEVSISFRPLSCHLFEKESGKRIEFAL